MLESVRRFSFITLIFFLMKILNCFPKHKMNEWKLIANYYSFCSWRDQSLIVIFGVAASGFFPFLLQFYSLITTGAFTTVMSTKLHLLYRRKNVLSQSKESHLWSGYHGVFLLRSIWALEVILFLTLFHPFFNLPHWHGVQSYLQAHDM